MFDVYPCSICGETGHRVGKCNELWQNKVPPPERGQGGDDDEDDSLLLIRLRVPKKVYTDLKIILI
jgi:hypothetical protein